PGACQVRSPSVCAEEIRTESLRHRPGTGGQSDRTRTRPRERFEINSCAPRGAGGNTVGRGRFASGETGSDVPFWPCDSLQNGAGRRFSRIAKLERQGPAAVFQRLLGFE